jgi:hypothetical protein
MDWWHGSIGRALASQARSLELKKLYFLQMAVFLK